MAQPAEVERTAQQLIRLYEQAQADMDAELEALANEARYAKRRTRARQVAANIETSMAALQASSSVWISNKLPGIYQLGAEDTAVRLGERFEWNPQHSTQLQALATETWDDVLARTRYVTDEARKWARQQVGRQTRLAVLEGRTAEQAVRALVSEAGAVADMFGGPVGLVRYSDGSYRRLADWADSAIRTTTARVHVAGTLNMGAQLGVRFYEGADGQACHLYGHDDGPLVDGRVFPIETAMAHPLAHPRCRRAWIPRVDVRTPSQASTAESLRPAEQMADQAQAEADRAETFRRARVARSPRAPRTPRTARSG